MLSDYERRVLAEIEADLEARPARRVLAPDVTSLIVLSSLALLCGVVAGVLLAVGVAMAASGVGGAAAAFLVAAGVSWLGARRRTRNRRRHRPLLKRPRKRP